MTKHPKGFAAAPWIETRINDVTLRPEYHTENSDAEQRILDAFWELREANKNGRELNTLLIIWELPSDLGLPNA